MDILTKKDIKKLMEKRADTCISIYIPTHPHGPEVQQNSIRLKNLVSEVEKQFEEIDWVPPDIARNLDPIQKLIHDKLFWEHQQNGLVIFRSPGETITFRLPLEFTETVVISKRYHLKPLIPLIRSDDRFYMLALSLGRMRLFMGSRYKLTEIEVPDFPQGIEEALKDDDPERQLQHQTLTRTGGGHPAIHHGHGDAYDSKENALR
jgi:hypothetical protein